MIARPLFDVTRDEVAFEDDEQDVFQCGKCKRTFTSFSAFVSHKKEHNAESRKQLSNATDINVLSDQSVNLVLTENVQNQELPHEITLTESDIISFGIDESAPLNITESPSLVLDSCTEIALLNNASDQSCDLPTISSEEVTIATSISNTDVLDECSRIVTIVPTVSPEEVTIATSVSAQSQNDLKCMYCVKSFKGNFDLQQHVRSHTGEKPFQCLVCGRAFAQKSNVKKHIATHKVWPKRMLTLPKNCIKAVSNPKERTCSQVTDGSLNDVCSNADSNNTNDTNSSSDYIDRKVCRSYLCQFCSSVFVSYGQWRNHIKEHKNEKVYRCIQMNCNAMFSEIEAFVKHSNSHESEALYHCHVCFKAFKSLDELGDHQYSHSLPTHITSKQVTCKICKVKFKNFESLQRHIEMDNHKYPCPKCSKEFKTERNLRQHLMVHSSSCDFSCPHCFMAFKKKTYLMNHMKTHSNEKNHTCPHCSSSFNRRDLLTRHLLTHESTKKYKCPFSKFHNCDREFNRTDKLKAHILTHCSKESLKCPKCNKLFLSKVRHKEHQKSCTGAELNFVSSCRTVNLPKPDCVPVPLESSSNNDDADEMTPDGNEASTIEVFVIPVKGKQKRKKKRAFS